MAVKSISMYIRSNVGVVQADERNFCIFSIAAHTKGFERTKKMKKHPRKFRIENKSVRVAFLLIRRAVRTSALMREDLDSVWPIRL